MHFKRINAQLGRRLASLVNYKDRFLFVSGGEQVTYPDPNLSLSIVEKYDIEANKWSSAPRLT